MAASPRNIVRLPLCLHRGKFQLVVPRCALGQVISAIVFLLTLVHLSQVGYTSTTYGNQAARPNILFIMSDDHGYQAMSCYGSKVNKTPNLDRLATEGMRFDRCFVTNSICGPSRAVILTGKYSHLNGFTRNGNRFNGAQQNVAKLLRKAGYQTAIVGKWHLATNPTGFDYWEVLIGQGPYYNPRMKTANGVVNHTGYTTDIITDLALDWLKEKRDDKKPFLLIYQHKAPHRNWQPGPKYLDKYDGVMIPEPDTLFDDYEGRSSAAKQQTMSVAKDLNPNDLKLVRQRGFTEDQEKVWNKAYQEKNEAFQRANLKGKDLIRWKYQRYVKDYLRCIDSVDENVGRVLDYLDESGLAENTIVFYTSDQGWYLGEHGWFDKRWMYEESFRTPLLVRWPGKVKPGSINTDLSMNLDFPETFLDIAGVEIPSDMQGRSLKGLLIGQTPDDWRKSVYYHYYEFPGAHNVRRHYGVRTDRYKLIRFYNIDEWELYDLQKDPQEMKSVYDNPAYTKIVIEMKQELEQLRQQYKDDGSVVDFDLQKAKNVKLKQNIHFDFSRLDEKLLSGKIVQGLHGKALKLSGDKAALTRERGEAFDPSYKPLTVGLWCKPERRDGVLIAQGGESLGYSLYLKAGQPQFAIRSGGNLSVVSGELLELNQWSHLVAVLDAHGQSQLYVNGRPVGKKKKAGFINNLPADGLTLGADNGSLVGEYTSPTPYQGLLEDVRVYEGAMKRKQIAEWAAK